MALRLAKRLNASIRPRSSVRAKALSRKPGHIGAVAFSRTGDPATGDFGDPFTSLVDIRVIIHPLYVADNHVSAQLIMTLVLQPLRESWLPPRAGSQSFLWR